ncbi:MAG: PEP-CTERM sorting domain-containing protein [Phycisphaerales bacterium]|nr:PEP-CTERM sorting domain-containing protein [Phycisphaerales bacterium]
MNSRSAAVVSLALGMAASVATAGPTFVAFANDTMYRFSMNGPIESFQMSDSMMSLARRGDGALVGHSPRAAGEQLWQSYELVDPTGAAPSLSLLSDQITAPRPTLSFVGSQGYAVGNTDELFTVDSGTLADSGSVGHMGLPTDSNGSGYDQVNDVLYIINGQNDALYRVDYGSAAPTMVGSLGVDYLFGGAEFFGGTMYAFIQDTNLQRFVFGSVDTSTGAFTMLRDIAGYNVNDNVYAALAVVPAPASLGLIGVGGLALLRRRR